MKPLKKVSTTWSPELAYCIGLIASDGNLSNDGRHITFVSTDLDLIETFKSALVISNSVGRQSSSYNPSGVCYKVQLGDVNFYRFLQSVGLTPAKSKTIARLKVPMKYFFHFLRGSFDGDGSFYSYFDKRWRSSFLFYLSFISASKAHLDWIQQCIYSTTKANGYFDIAKGNRVFQLKYAKTEALKIIKLMYENSDSIRLERKYKKVYNALAIDRRNNNARVL